MRQTDDLSKRLLETAKVTRGRIGARETYRDFIAYCAMTLSLATDPVHRDRETSLQQVLKQYKEAEQAFFKQTLCQLIETVVENTRRGRFDDLFTRSYYEVGANNRSMKQEFTPPDVARLLAQITFNMPSALPEEGYFTLNDPTCGTGNLILSAAEHISDRGYNPSTQLVVQVSDLDAACAQMAYVQLSLYGIPAVVVHGDIIQMKELSRWYTPAYIWGRWVWREPMPFGSSRNQSDEMLKMLDEPMYAACRQMDQLFRKTGETA